MMRTKVIHVIWDLESVGGAEKLLIHIGKNIDKHKYDVAFVSIINKGYMGQDLEDLGFQVICLSPRFKKAINPMITIKLYKIFKEMSPDIVHVHLNYSSIIAAKLAGVPIIVNHIHNIYPNKPRLKIIIESFLFMIPTISIAVSENVKRYTTSQIGLSENRIRVVPNGIDQQFLNNHSQIPNYDPKIEGISEDDEYIINVGSLTEQKDQSLLISAFHRVNQQFDNIKLLIVGDGPLKSKLVDQVNSLNLNRRIIFAGLRNDVPYLLKRSKIFILSSLWEGIPIALLEAMYFGLPCIVTNVGGVGEVVSHNENGLLVQAGNDVELSNMICLLLQDPVYGMTLGQKAQTRVQSTFTANKTVEKIQDIYSNMLMSPNLSEN
jgi:glycosyltransferase involved in cell wall biosynthesis